MEKTNGDRLREMSNEQLAAFIDEITLACFARGQVRDAEEREEICKACPIGDYTGCCENSILFYLNQPEV